MNNFVIDSRYSKIIWFKITNLIYVYHTSVTISCQIKSGILKYNYQPEKLIGYGENLFVSNQIYGFEEKLAP